MICECCVLGRTNGCQDEESRESRGRQRRDFIRCTHEGVHSTEMATYPAWMYTQIDAHTDRLYTDTVTQTGSDVFHSPARNSSASFCSDKISFLRPEVTVSGERDVGNKCVCVIVTVCFSCHSLIPSLLPTESLKHISLSSYQFMRKTTGTVLIKLLEGTFFDLTTWKPKNTVIKFI